jgi:hypothetical protein
MKIGIAIALALGLAGCATMPPGSVHGECQVFHDPGFAVRGKTLKDNQWIGRTQETGIEVCGWKRPRK